MKLVIFLYDQLYASGIRNSNANTSILHGASNTNRLAGCHGSVIILFNGLQSFYQTGGFIYDLSVGKNLAGTDGVAIADFPRSNSHLVSHHI